MAAKILLSREGGKGKKLILKVNVAAKGLPDVENVVGLWREDTHEVVGHTDVVKGSDPTFTTELILDHYLADDLPVKFCVYSVTSDPLTEGNFVGAHTTTLGAMFKGKNPQEFAMETGTLCLKVVVMPDPNQKKKEKKEKKVPEKKLSKKEAEALKAQEKAIKTSVKEGGKKGQDICGMSSFGCHFFCVSMDSCGDDWALMDKVMEGMNKPVDPDGDDRKGGAADLGKILFAAGEGKLIMYAHVPADRTEGVTAEDFLTAVSKPVDGKIIFKSEDGFFVKAEVAGDVDAEKFPLKMKDAAIAAGFQYLREKQLILDDDESDDDINFADDCGVDLNAGAEGDY